MKTNICRWSNIDDGYPPSRCVGWIENGELYVAIQHPIGYTGKFSKHTYHTYDRVILDSYPPGVNLEGTPQDFDTMYRDGKKIVDAPEIEMGLSHYRKHGL